LLLTKATKISDIMAIESQLDSREADMESLMRQQASLTDQVSLSTITVSVTAVIKPLAVVKAATAPAPTGFAKGIGDGWQGLKSFVKTVLQIVGALLPFLPVIAVVVAAVWFIAKRARRRAEPQAPLQADE
jgi:hypothetical protein